ncbi:MAG: tetratricopeptide repeat protein, partial [Patescibacteria group bacterium]|nr:tetratricopeptide repeat protein [Patescibacteria group bacterium]
NYLLFRNYISEFYFKKSIDSISKNNLKETYDNQKKAIILNPFIEKYHINFSQTNLIIANNLIENLKLSTNEAKINDQDRQNIAQAIQQAIIYAKDGAVALNPQKAQNWQNLGEIYKNIIGLAQDADLFAIASYERAIILDPQNPVYRLNLGGIYYLLGKYNDALKFFEQAVFLKPDWPNAYYNLAWSYYKNQQFDKAVASMNNVIRLINKEKNKSDWEKANQELEIFKNKLKEKETKEEKENSQLTLPKEPDTIEPKINL